MNFIFGLVMLAIATFVASSSIQNVCFDEGEEYRECGTACPLTCNQPEVRPCTLQCIEGCYCKKDLFRDSTSGRCVTKAECQEIISANDLTQS